MQSLDQIIGSLVKNALDEIVAIERKSWDSEILTREELITFLRTSRSGLDNLRDNPRKNFPKPIAMDTWPRWLRSEVLAWVKANRQEK